MNLFLIIKYWKKHLKEVFSIILSISILCSSLMCCMLISRSQILQEYNELLDTYGGYDMRYLNVSNTIIEEFKAEKIVDEIGTMQIVGKIGDDNTQVTFGYLDKTAEKLIHYPMESGRLPKNKGEIAIEKSTLSALGISSLIGINIELKIFDTLGNYKKSQSFTLVGIIDDLSSSRIDRYNNEVSYNEKNSMYGLGNYPDPIVCVSKEDALQYEYTNIAVTYVGGDKGLFPIDEIKNVELQNFISSPENSAGGLGRVGTVSLFANGFDNTFEDIQNGETLTKTSITKITEFLGFLCFVISTISLFSVMIVYSRKKSNNNKLIYYCGMSKKSLIKLSIIESFLFFILGILLGLILGSLFYEIILYIEKEIFFIPVYRGYIIDVDFIRRKTKNPFLFAILISCIVCIVGFTISYIVKFSNKHTNNKKIINKTLQLKRQNLMQLISIIITITFGSIGMIYLKSSIDLINTDSEFYFYTDIGDDIRKTGYDFSLYREKYNDINRFCAINTSSGLSDTDVKEISQNEYVQSVEAVLTDKTARFYVEKNAENVALMENLNGYDIKSMVKKGCDDLNLNFEQSWKSHNQYYESYGLNDMDYNYYYTSIVACNDTIFNQLEEYLISGTIDIDGIKNGSKVLIIEGNSSYNMCENPFKVGDTIHLFNSYYNNENEWKNAINNDISYFINTEVSFKDVEVCGIIQAPNNNIYQTLLVKDYSFFNNYTLITTLDGYNTWNFAQNNYDSINIKLKSSSDTISFQEKVLPKYITNNTGLSIISLSYGYKKINQEIGKVLVQVITMIILLLLIFIIGYINTIKLQLQLNKKRFGILQALGMSKKQLIKKIICENLKFPILCTFLSYLIYNVLKFGYEKLFYSINLIIHTDANTSEEVEKYMSALSIYTDFQLNLQLHTYNIIPYMIFISLVIYIISIIVSLIVYNKDNSNIINTIKDNQF